MPDLVKTMGEAFPELAAAGERVAQVLAQEETRLCRYARQRHGGARRRAALGRRMLDGDTVFRLYDTYGFPLDLTADIARERGVTSISPASRRRWAAARTAPRAASKFGTQSAGRIQRRDRFHGYDTLTLEARSPRSTRRATAVQAIAARRQRGDCARQDAVLRRIRRPGRRPRAAHREPRHVSTARHAESPGRSVRPSRRAGIPHVRGRRHARAKVDTAARERALQSFSHPP